LDFFSPQCTSLSILSEVYQTSLISHWLAESPEEGNSDTFPKQMTHPPHHHHQLSHKLTALPFLTNSLITNLHQPHHRSLSLYTSWTT
jgi:hypothetical protein